MPNPVASPSLASFQNIAYFAKAKKIALGATFVFACLTIISAVTGRFAHLESCYDVSMGTGSATFVGGVVASACAYRERKAKRDFIQPLHDDFVRRKVISCNRLQRTYKNKDAAFYKATSEEYLKKILSMREMVACEVGENLFPSCFHRTQTSAKYLEKQGIGNCLELSCKAFVDLMKQFPNLDLKIDVYQILGGDHVFLVIGREIGSDPKDYRTWGKSAMVYDPWFSEYDAPVFYPATEIESQLKDDLDLRIHSLLCAVSNLYSPREFARVVDTRDDRVMALHKDLRKLHAVDADKAKIAGEMLVKTKEYLQRSKKIDSNTHKAVAMLHAQLEHYRLISCSAVTK